MLYTIEDVKDKLRSIEDTCRLIKVEIDGEVKGFSPYSDLWDQVVCENNRRRIRKVFLAGKTYDVRIGINLYKASPDELWGGDAKRSVDEEQREKAELRGLPKPIVSYDAQSGLIRFRNRASIFVENAGTDNAKLFTRDDLKNKKKPKRTEKCGIFERVLRWIKGDVGYKR